MSKKKLIELLNRALELEHAARIQYLSHAETISGPNAEPIIARLKEIAGDELKHEQIFREQLGALGATPSTSLAKTFSAKGTTEILETNLKNEMDAIDFYRTIIDEIRKSGDELKYEDFKLEHEVRHVIIDEMEHVEELRVLLGRQ